MLLEALDKDSENGELGVFGEIHSLHDQPEVFVPSAMLAFSSLVGVSELNQRPNAGGRSEDQLFQQLNVTKVPRLF
jgi:hypothetical protein